MDSTASLDPRRAIARCAVAVIAADGRLAPEEVDAVARLRALGLGDLAPLVQAELEQAMRAPIDLRPAGAVLAGAGPRAAGTILSAMAELALSDGELVPTEEQAFAAIAEAMGVDADDARGILEAVAHHRAAGAGDAPEPIGVPPSPEAGTAATGTTRTPPPPPRAAPAAGGPSVPGSAAGDALRALGLRPGASRDDVDAAYLALVARYDPHAMTAMGPEFVALAVRRLAAATRAWETATAALAAA